MKKCLFIIFLLISIMYIAQAQFPLITVQTGNETKFYGDLTMALDSSQAGSVLYLSGGTYSSETTQFIIKKKFIIYGVGHNPDSNSVTGITRINANITFDTGSDSSAITGVYCTNPIYINQSVYNILIKRCRMTNLSLNGNNAYIEENIIDGNIVGGNKMINSLLEKNIITGGISLMNYSLFKNNIMLATSSPVFGWGNTSYSTFENNIFLNLSADSSFNLSACINLNFNNNIFADFTFSNNASNSLSKNIMGQAQSSIFENQTGNTFFYHHNYHLKSTCPGVGAGTDGTDIGIYGTSEPYKDGALPDIPHIIQDNSSTGSSNGLFKIDIKVEAQSK